MYDIKYIWTISIIYVYPQQIMRSIIFIFC